MTTEEKKELKEIVKMINDNQVDAWEDNLEETKPVVILDDFDKGVPSPNVTIRITWTGIC
jgi:threonine dehydrogenase-like Zn-dependent dehydrogenase